MRWLWTSALFRTKQSRVKVNNTTIWPCKQPIAPHNKCLLSNYEALPWHKGFLAADLPPAKRKQACKRTQFNCVFLPDAAYGKKTALVLMTVDLKKNNPKRAYHLRLTKVWQVNNIGYHVTTTLEEGNWVSMACSKRTDHKSDPYNIHFAIYETYRTSC